MKNYKQVAVQAAKLAGGVLQKRFIQFKQGSFKMKGKHEIVTKADYEANTVIIKTIKKHFPDHDFLSEETGLEDNPNTYQWVIDPLDGTTNFTVHNPLFCTVISLVNKKRILLSIIYAPILNEFYYAEKGKGAYLNNKKIRVSDNRKLSKSIIVLTRSHNKDSHRHFIKVQKRLVNNVLNTRMYGSTALSLAATAAGRLDGCIVVPPEVFMWDVLAGILLVREAGGAVTGHQGEKWNCNSRGVIASNKDLNKPLIKIVKK